MPIFRQRLFPGLVATSALLALLAGCGALPNIGPTIGTAEQADGPPPYPLDLSGVPDAVPRVEPLSRYGNPPSYEVFNRRYYVLETSENHVEQGIASWYGTKFHGRRTSSGEPYDMYAMTAAHKSLPLPTYAEVVNLENGRQIIVKINDRGPFVGDRIIDLSYAAAVRLGIAETGTGRVEVRAIDPVAYNARPETAPQPAYDGAAFYLQIGAFSQAENAARLRSRLDSFIPGDGIHVVRTETSTVPLYRVRIGPLSDRTEADRISRDLIALGHTDTQIIVD